MRVGEVRSRRGAEAQPCSWPAQEIRRPHGRAGQAISLKGRDFFALPQTIPGVVDTTASRDTSSNVAGAGIFINGNRDNQKNVSVDGIRHGHAL
jgi:hypothetical protein